jgi:hypothetical protein
VTICDLRHVPGNSGPYFTVGPDRMLILSVASDDVVACNACPQMHVRVLRVATPTQLRELAQGLRNLAAELERA